MNKPYSPHYLLYPQLAMEWNKEWLLVHKTGPLPSLSEGIHSLFPLRNAQTILPSLSVITGKIYYPVPPS